MKKAYDNAMSVIWYKKEFSKLDLSIRLESYTITITDKRLIISYGDDCSEGISFNYEAENITCSANFDINTEEKILWLISKFLIRLSFSGEIYKITNKINGKVYIGQTIGSSTNRWGSHKSGSEKSKISKAIESYGIINFTFEVIEVLILDDNLTERERFWIKHYDSIKNGYNARM